MNNEQRDKTLVAAQTAIAASRALDCAIIAYDEAAQAYATAAHKALLAMKTARAAAAAARKAQTDSDRWAGHLMEAIIEGTKPQPARTAGTTQEK